MSEIVFRKIESIGTRGKDGRIPATLSTEYPVQRHFGKEVLDHSPESIDLTRAKRGLPLLFGHDQMEPIGRIENIHLEGRRLKGFLRAGNSTKAKEVWQDIEEGILQDLSIGYEILDNGVKEDEDTCRFMHWMPYEASILPIGADPNAGVNRALKITNNKEDCKMDTITKENEEPKNRAARREEKFAERERVREILALGKKHACIDGAHRAINEGWELDDFKAYILKTRYKVGQPIDTNPAFDYGNSGIGLNGREVEIILLSEPCGQ